MKLRPILPILLVCATPLAAAPKEAKPIWVGAWGYVTAPLPPGLAPAPLQIAPVAAPVPLAPPPAAAPSALPPSPLLENPGRLPVDTSGAELSDVTLRQLVRVSIAGSAVRLRLSNENGTDALAIGAVHVGLAGADGSIVPGSDHVVTFDGNGGVTIPAGAPLLSDAVALPVKALDRLAVSLYVPGRLPARPTRSQFQYIAGASGDSSAAATLANARLARAQAIVTMVEVAAAPSAGVVVALGDSITEGALSTSNAFRSWPDRLAERLAADPAGKNWAVVNAGIGGNRLLRYGTGPNALARFDRDVLGVPGVKVIILLEGINDIGRGFTPLGGQEPVTAAALIAADKQIIERAHAHGIRVIGATLTPYKGASYSSEKGEAARQELNTWIKTSGAFDGVVDLAPSVADPADPLTFDKRYNERDRLHPNDAGYQAMANAIDLKLITGK
jgi:lysophospholipase L1-like esterase